MSGKKRFYRNKLSFFLPLIYLIFSIPASILEKNDTYLYHNQFALWQILSTLSMPYYWLSLPIAFAISLILNCPLKTTNERCDQAFAALPTIGFVFYLVVGLMLDCYRLFLKRSRRKA